MSRQVSRGSDGVNQAEEQTGVAQQLAIIKQMIMLVSHGSAGDYQTEEQASVTRLSWPQSSRRAGRCRTAQLEYIKQMSR